MATPSDTEMWEWVEKHQPYFTKTFSSRGELICCRLNEFDRWDGRTYREAVAAAMADEDEDG